MCFCVYGTMCVLVFVFKGSPVLRHAVISGTTIFESVRRGDGLGDVDLLPGVTDEDLFERRVADVEFLEVKPLLQDRHLGKHLAPAGVRRRHAVFQRALRTGNTKLQMLCYAQCATRARRTRDGNFRAQHLCANTYYVSRTGKKNRKRFRECFAAHVHAHGNFVYRWTEGKKHAACSRTLVHYGSE